MPRDGDDEDISADVAESAVLAMEPDVPDTRKMLIRVRRKQSLAAVAARYQVSIAQLRAWNKTRRETLMPGQVIVLHVPVGKTMPAEPGPQKIATEVPADARAEKIEARAAEVKPKAHSSRSAARGGARTKSVKVAARAAAGKGENKADAPARKSVETASKSVRKSSAKPVQGRQQSTTVASSRGQTKQQ